MNITKDANSILRISVTDGDVTTMTNIWKVIDGTLNECWLKEFVLNATDLWVTQKTTDVSNAQY